MKSRRGKRLILLLLASFVLGLALARGITMIGQPDTKPVTPVETSRQQLLRVNPETPVVLEKVFFRCSHRVISEFKDKDQLVGKTLKDLSGEYAHTHGYLISVGSDNSVVVTERLDALCSECEVKRHLAVKDGILVVYKGPAGYERELLNVTNIQFARLPAQVQKDIEQGKLEFKSQDELNFGLESLEEYEQ
ncbi:MAG: BofC C-terminal domain-containing protein [Methylocystaceae bacterium]